MWAKYEQKKANLSHSLTYSYRHRRHHQHQLYNREWMHVVFVVQISFTIFSHTKFRVYTSAKEHTGKICCTYLRRYIEGIRIIFSTKYSIQYNNIYVETLAKRVPAKKKTKKCPIKSKVQKEFFSFLDKRAW